MGRGMRDPNIRLVDLVEDKRLRGSRRYVKLKIAPPPPFLSLLDDAEEDVHCIGG